MTAFGESQLMWQPTANSRFREKRIPARHPTKQVKLTLSGRSQTQEISRNRRPSVIVPGQIADGRMAKLFAELKWRHIYRFTAVS